MDTKTFASIWYMRALVALALAGLVMSLMAYAHTTWQEGKYGFMGPTTINVMGEGEILARPDIGTFSFSVRAEAEDAATAQDLSAESINSILAYLKEAGVDEKDVKTNNYYLNPTYSYEERVCSGNGYCPPGERVIDGYEVSQTVTVKVRDLDKSGDLISGAGDRGATNISSLQFTIDDETVLQDQARAAAIADAKDKAKALAKDLDVRLVRMTGFSENDGGYYPEPYYAMDMAESVSMNMKSAPSMPTGENSIHSTVYITYEIK